MPYSNLTAALVLDDVRFRVTDFGTSYTTPEDYLDRLVRFGLYTTDETTGVLHAVPLDEIDAIVAAVRTAQSAHYRNIAAMDRNEKIRCGAYVYFSFLRPFALVAGIGDELDWTVPRDIPAAALRPRVDARRRQHGGQHGRRRCVLRTDPMTADFDEHRHEPEGNDWQERWTFEAWDIDGTFGAVAAVTLLPACT